jgi:PhnB protein
MIVPTFNFNGKCREAIAFYETVFKTRNKEVLTYGSIPGVLEGMKDWIFSAKIELDGFLVFLADSANEIIKGTTVTVTVTCPSPGRVTELFNKLLEGGSVLVELSPKPFSQMHGCVKDKFGVTWQIMVQ